MHAIILSALLLLLPSAGSIHTFKVKDVDGKTIDFSNFKGKKILIVNTASECGYTRQYQDLQELHNQYGKKVAIIAFPANNFGGQEPGSNEEIKSFCSKNYQVSFPIAGKVSVKGSDMAPIFQWLTTQENPDFTGDINWNFEKFLLDENGKLLRRYRSRVKPTDPAITGAL
jgi:glutathione peroxidase